MNPYMSLNGKKYATLGRSWQETYNKPGTARVTLLGRTDVTYGPAVITGWDGEIKVPVQAATGWGIITDFMTAVQTRAAMTFIDHYSNTYSVHLMGTFQRKSLMNMWDSNSNSFIIPVKLVKET
jgi:hypothetical protein